jgi:hypothetical protein
MARHRFFMLFGAGLAMAAPLAAQDSTAHARMTPAEEQRFLALGKQYTRWFLNGFADSMSTAFDSTVLTQLGGANGIRDQMNVIAERGGSETRMLTEKMTLRNGQPQFWHEGEFSVFTNEPLVIRWVLNKDGKIVGVGFGPKSSTPAPDQD